MYTFGFMKDQVIIKPPYLLESYLDCNRYCDCFANGEFCNNCNCVNCSNNMEHEKERSKAIKVSRAVENR